MSRTTPPSVGVESPPDDGRLLKLSEVAALLRCNERTVSKMIARGELAAVRIAGRLLVSREEVDAYLERSAVGRQLSVWPEDSLKEFLQ